MAKTYSTYEAKARLSELLKQVRNGDVVTITRHGEPVAELRPVQPPDNDLAGRIDRLRRDGIISPRKSGGSLKALVRRKGALARFLDSRE